MALASMKPWKVISASSLGTSCVRVRSGHLNEMSVLRQDPRLEGYTHCRVRFHQRSSVSDIETEEVQALDQPHLIQMYRLKLR